MATPSGAPGEAAMKWAYRQWLLEQVGSEVESGCARLFAIRGSLFLYFRDVIRGWPPEKVADLMRSRIKQMTLPLLTPLALSPQEREVADSFVWPIYKYATPGRPQVLVTYPHGGVLPVDEDKRAIMELKDRIGRREFKVNRSELKRKALSALRPLLGKPFNMNGEYLFWTRVSNFTVETDVDMASPIMGQLHYWHMVYWGDVDRSNRCDIVHLPRMSISDLLNDGTGMTTWNCLTDADVDSSVELLVQLVTNFLEAMPGIVEAARDYEARNQG
jgi:hypothetical protein